NTTSNTAGNFLTIKSGGSTSSSTDKDAGALNLSTGVSTGTGTGEIRFFTTSAGTSGTTDNANSQKMVVTGSGNLGIGTSTPYSGIHLYSPSGSSLLNSGAPFGNGPEIAFSKGGFYHPGASIQMVDYDNWSAGLV